jgi:hypothetical protein
MLKTSALLLLIVLSCVIIYGQTTTPQFNDYPARAGTWVRMVA